MHLKAYVCDLKATEYEIPLSKEKHAVKTAIFWKSIVSCNGIMMYIVFVTVSAYTFE